MFGSSGSPFTPVSTKEGLKEPPVAPAPAPKPESSSNVVSSTMDDEERMNIKVTVLVVYHFDISESYILVDLLDFSFRFKFWKNVQPVS